MAKHDINAKRVILERLLKKEAGKIESENILSYLEELELDDLDLVYKKFVTDRLAEIELGSNPFLGYFDTLVELEAVEEVPEGAYAYVGTGVNFKIYFYDLIAEAWSLVVGDQGPAGEIDLDETDLRYLRKDVPETVTEPFTVQNLILDIAVSEESPIFYVGILADGTAVPVTISAVTGDKNAEIEVSTPATVWTINHNFGKKPAFRVKDSAGNPQYPSWDDPSVNQLVLTFEAPVSGIVILN